ncbi:hypothetical protein [Flavobacterium sp.]|jgi:serine/threonine-protein kinase|uniref:hypothetical protein n=1 Tax=Flavobacterium sp. TaxID=239 RepID=UPI0033427F43
MKKILFLLPLVFNLNAFGQIKESSWKTIDESSYSIQYPENWELNVSETMGTSFILLSQQTSAEDKFRANINLSIQNLEGYYLNLDAYVAISEEQITKMITNGTIIESNRIIIENKTEFQKIIFTGKQGLFQLKFLQYYFIKDEKAYVLTFTSEASQYEKYNITAEQILESFLLK